MVAIRTWHFAVWHDGTWPILMSRGPRRCWVIRLCDSANEARIEARFKAILLAAAARQQLRAFTAEPHLAGSSVTTHLAQYIAAQWRKQGLTDIVLRRYDVYTSEPRETLLEMVELVTYRASLREAAYSQDPDTGNPSIRSAWIGMSGSGDITAPVIYAHSGNPRTLRSCAGTGSTCGARSSSCATPTPTAIAVSRRLTAEKAAAAAILIYSDPAEDGYARGEVFPDGPWGPETHFQRGAIEYDYPQIGDPTTPGWPSLPGSVPHSQHRRLPCPRSWRCHCRGRTPTAAENMDGPQAPKEWQGALPIGYHLGGERVKVHLKIKMTESFKANYVVEGSIRGT